LQKEMLKFIIIINIIILDKMEESLMPA
jgi:hypothetical protein